MSNIAQKQVPEGYKQTEVGVIPNDWIVSSLSQLTLDMLQGVNTAIDIPEYVEDGIPMLKANNVIDQVVKFHGCDSISEKTYKGYSDRFKLKRNDFLFSNIGARLGTGSLLNENIECSFAWNVMRIVPNQKMVVPRFLAFQINAPKNSEKIKSEQSGSGMGFIPKTTMLQVQLAIPKDLCEQTAIANTLSDVDALIISIEKLIAKKRAIKTAAMQQLLTGKKRLPPFDQTHTGYKQTELGEIPEDWEVREIQDVAKVKGGKRLPKGELLLKSSTKHPYIRVADMFVGGVDLSDIHYVPENVAPKIKNYRIKSTDLFISVAGTLGIVGKIPEILDGANLTENADKITDITVVTDYLLYWLMSEKIQNEIASQSTVGAQPKLALGRIESFKIAFPKDFEEQTEIAKVLSDMEKEINALEQRLNKTQQLKQGMMQELLTGKTRLVEH